MKKLEQEIFEQAIALSSREAREGFLLGACGQDRELRQRVDELLAAFKDAGELDFLRTGDRSQGAQTVLTDTTLHEGPGTVIGRYKLLQKIGEGGMGVVYMAEQEQPVRRRVALKIIKLGMDTRQVVARFEAERQALAMMDHPNIARVLDGGATETGRPYFVMELVQGVPITEFCDKNKLPARERMRLFIQVCQAVQSAHQKGIIHRDIKPSNVLVTLHHGEPMPKVIDFGIAKATNQKLTEKTLFTNYATMIGTPAYMSPEQAEMTSMDVDTRTDVYSLGVLLYELLTGSTPFPEKRLRSLGYGEMQRVIVDEEPERPSTRLSTMANEQKTVVAKNRGEELASLSKLLRGDLDWVVMRCLEKDRRRRYDTPNELTADIERHLKNEPVVARPPTVNYRFQKMVKRNKLAFAAASAVTLTLIVGLSLSTWSFLRERKAHAGEVAQHRTAEEQRERADEQKKLAEQQKTVAETAERETARLLIESQRNAYFANMNLAQADWEQNNLARVWQSLEETRDYPERGFEWYYWRREMHRELRTLRGHLNRIGGLAISPDGRWIATASNDETVKVWELATGHEVSTCIGHKGWVRSVAFFPDNRRIVSCGDKTVRVWEASTGRELLIFPRDTAEVLHVAVSKEPARIVTGNGEGIAKVWDADTGRELHPLRGHKGQIWGVAISADGQRVLTGGKDGELRVWDLQRSEMPVHVLPHSPRTGKGVWSVAFSPDEKWIVSASQDATVKLWDAVTGELRRTLSGHRGWVFSAAFSPDGQQIVTGGFDGTARVWAAESGEELQQIKGHLGTVFSAAFAPDGRTIVTSGIEGDHTAKIWDLASASGPLTLKHGAPGKLGTLDIRHRIRDAGPTALNIAAGVWSVAFSPDAQRLVTAGDGAKATIWNVRNGEPVRSLEGHTSVVYAVAFSPDGRRAVTGSADRTARIWELEKEGQPLVLQGHNAAINSVAFSPDGELVATASDDRTVKLWEASSGREHLTFRGHTTNVLAVAFSPQGDWIVSGGDDNKPRIWDPSSGQQLREFAGTEGQDCIFSLAVSPDGQRIAAARWLFTTTVWDAVTGRHLFDLKGHTFPVWSVAFSSDGRRLVTGSWDSLVKVWDAFSGRETLTLRGHADEVKSVAFSPDGTRIASDSLDGAAKIWTAATPKEVAAWQKEEAEATHRLDALRLERKAAK